MVVLRQTAREEIARNEEIPENERFANLIKCFSGYVPLERIDFKFCLWISSTSGAPLSTPKQSMQLNRMQTTEFTINPKCSHISLQLSNNQNAEAGCGSNQANKSSA